MISNAVCLSVRLSVCLPLCPSSRSSPSFPLNAKEMSFAKLGKQRVGVGKKLSKFATWSPKEGGKGIIRRPFIQLIGKDGRKETQFSTKQMSSFLRCGAARRGNDTRRGRTGTVRVVHTPRTQVAARHAGAQPFPSEVFLSSALFPPTPLSGSVCLPVSPFWYLPSVPGPQDKRLEGNREKLTYSCPAGCN